jgi:hypothetical protein
MTKSWPAIAKQLLAVFLLCVLGFFASGWAGLYCYHFGSPFQMWSDDAHLTVLQETPYIGIAADWGKEYLPSYYFGAALAAVWIAGMAVYLWRVRSSLIGMALAALPFGLFVWASLGNLLMLWPACNAF